jgi:hypothetical protein
MSDLFDRIVSQRGSFENLMLKVPGYKGYKDASDRRAADRMMRDHIVNGLKMQLGRLVDAERRMISKGGLSLADETSEAKAKFQNFIDKINTAMPGYAGFFDAQKIGQAELDTLYHFDAALLAYVDKFETAIDTFNAAVGDKDALIGAISSFEALANEALQAYSLREDAITKIG